MRPQAGGFFRQVGRGAHPTAPEGGRAPRDLALPCRLEALLLIDEVAMRVSITGETPVLPRLLPRRSRFLPLETEP